MISSPAHVHVRATRWCGLAALVALAAAGCTTDANPPETGETGTLVLPLVQTGPNGELFHLNNAIFDITGIRNDFAVTVDGSGFAPSVSVEVPPGLINIFLRDGWSLEKSTDGGATFVPVGAVLGTFNPNGARILANVPTTTRFDFLVHNVNGTLQIRLGVTDAPRELAGGYNVDTATGEFAPYTASQDRQFDFALFYDLFAVSTETLPDGTKQRVYTANHVGGEFYNDHLGLYAGRVARTFSGAFLDYTVAARPDGTFEFSGQISGGTLDSFSDLRWGPSAIDAITSPTLDADGFPNDEFFYDSETPFTHDIDFDTVTGILRIRHLIPGSPGPGQ